MISRSSECHKFVPNIFQKKKCSSCFRNRIEHNVNALNEFDQMPTKILKCGYLFIASDWDLNVPTYRSKIDTVPQGKIEITDPIEVSLADDITGHSFSLCIKKNDKRIFIKGSYLEEIKWWYNALLTFIIQKKHTVNWKSFGGIGLLLNIKFNNVFYFLGYNFNCTESMILANDKVNENKKNDFKRSSTSKPSKDFLNHSKTSQPFPPVSKKKHELTQTSQERGDPDGDCGIENNSIKYMSRRFELHDNAENKINKGWLYKKENYGVWIKYWVSRVGSELLYYTDPTSEEPGNEHGVLNIKNIKELYIDNTFENKFSFIANTYDERTIILAAISANARQKWINEIQYIRNTSGKRRNHINKESLSRVYPTDTVQMSNMPGVHSKSDLKKIGTNAMTFNPHEIENKILLKEYNDLKYRFTKTKDELRTVKKEVKNAHYIYDILEIEYKALKLQMEKIQFEQQGRVSMMAERIEDLTNKYTVAERQSRQLKLKLSRIDKQRLISVKETEITNQDNQQYCQKILSSNLQQIENKLTHKLYGLLEARQTLFENNKLSSAQKRNLLLQRLAFESVCFEKIKTKMYSQNINFLRNFSNLSEIESKIADFTSQLNDNEVLLTQKKNIDNSENPAELSTEDILFLASQKQNTSNILEKLLILQQNMISSVEKYQKQKIEKILNSILVENWELRANILQNVFNEIKKCALKKTNEDLVKFEKDHVMNLFSKSIDTLIISPLPLTMLTTDMLFFEILVDIIYDSLKCELDSWYKVLKAYFNNETLNIKTGQKNFHGNREKKRSEKRITLDVANIIALKSIIDGQIIFLSGDHSIELPNTIDLNEYVKFIEELKDQYIISESSFNTYERELCQKEMDAMRSSHISIINEMKENHKIQIQQLINEKERALEEETKATLAALDVMQKAHKNEVYREVIRFKEQILKENQQFSKMDDTFGYNNKQFENGDIQQQIRFLTGQYTNKCLQVVSLEERLQNSQNKIQELENKLNNTEIFKEKD
uniref:CSON008213 protein n=1 Tax=Culicoides sonorensis TaxID=179676 RepID=A0A336LNQ4_CULSO